MEDGDFDKLTRNFAWGVIDLRSDEPVEIGPEVGNFYAVHRSKEFDQKMETKDLKWHFCSKVELGLDFSSDAMFYEPD